MNIRIAYYPGQCQIFDCRDRSASSMYSKSDGKLSTVVHIAIYSSVHLLSCAGRELTCSPTLVRWICPWLAVAVVVCTIWLQLYQTLLHQLLWDLLLQPLSPILNFLPILSRCVTRHSHRLGLKFHEPLPIAIFDHHIVAELLCKFALSNHCLIASHPCAWGYWCI
jgi:hypothetical protein